MMLTKFARNYSTDKNKTPYYAARQFARYTGDRHVGQITKKHIDKYIDGATADNLSPNTIRTGLKYVRILVRSCTGKTIETPKIKCPPPQPAPTPIEWIDAAYEHANDWLRTFLVVAFWTGLRCTDCLRFLMEYEPGAELTHLASKTQKRHSWPAPAWVRRHLDNAETTYTHVTPHTGRLVRADLAEVCRLADCGVIYPQQLRQRSITQWSKANGTAGQIVHGCRNGARAILNHYIADIEILEEAAPRVIVPSSFLTRAERDAKKQESAELLELFAKKSEAQRQFILTAARSA